MHETMRFASSITDARNAQDAVDELLVPIGERLTPGMADLAMLFCTAHFEDELPQVVDQIAATLPGAVLIGCTAEGTIGADRELERTPSMSLLVASLPDVRIHPFRLREEELRSIKTVHDWERTVGVSAESRPTFLVLGDPFRFNLQAFINKINENFPEAPMLGGIASAARRPMQNRLILNDGIRREGIVGVALSGRLAVETVVSQGCRPIGKPFVITRGERNVMQELGGKAPLERLRDVLVDLPERDEKLARQSLFVGRVIDEYKDHFQRGDFLIQNIIGVDRETGAMGIAGLAKTGSTVQFHIRDAASADEDLRLLLKPHVDSGICGAALFGCNGRGTNMWPQGGHDVGVLHEMLGPVPVAGFFCGGEFGPVGRRNFVHGFTASIALFRDPGARLDPLVESTDPSS